VKKENILSYAVKEVNDFSRIQISETNKITGWINKNNYSLTPTEKVIHNTEVSRITFLKICGLLSRYKVRKWKENKIY